MVSPLAPNASTPLTQTELLAEQHLNLSGALDNILTAKSDNDISISSYLEVQSSAHLDLDQTLYNIEFTDSTLANRFASDGLDQMDSLIQEYNALYGEFQASQVNTAATDPATTNLNTYATSTNTSISHTRRAQPLIIMQ